LRLPPDNNLINLINDTLTDKNPIKHVLSDAGEEKIECVEFDPSIYPNINSCPITIKDFKKGDKISKLPCQHLFNPEAILKWLKEEKAECPICRFKMDSVEKKIVDCSMNLINRVNDHRVNRRVNRRVNSTQEDNALQAALFASLEDQYMPEI